jgi:hypothetical protein
MVPPRLLPTITFARRAVNGPLSVLRREHVRQHGPPRRPLPGTTCLNYRQEASRDLETVSVGGDVIAAHVAGRSRRGAHVPAGGGPVEAEAAWTRRPVARPATPAARRKGRGRRQSAWPGPSCGARGANGRRRGPPPEGRRHGRRRRQPRARLAPDVGAAPRPARAVPPPRSGWPRPPRPRSPRADGRACAPEGQKRAPPPTNQA